MSSLIVHTATIVKIADGFVMLVMDKKPACNGCAMKKMCGVSDCTQDTIKIAVRNSQDYAVGEEVLLNTTVQKGYLALFFGYILPFLLVVATLVLLYQLKYSDFVLGVSALLSLVVYYFVLWLMKKNISQQFTIQIHKKT